MRPFIRNPWHRCRNPWRPALVGIGVAVLAIALLPHAVAADSTAPDNRATKSGKPLVYRSIDAVALDRDDLDASTTQSEDHRGLSPFVRAPSEGSSSEQKGTVPLSADGFRIGSKQPIGRSTTIANRADRSSDQTDAVEQQPDGYPADRGPPSMPPPIAPHNDLPGGIWPHDYLRHELAEPLAGASWCNEPYHVDWFLGAIRGTELIPNRVDQNVGVIGGFRIGWDYDLYWGLETRLASSSLEDQPENAPLAGGADKVILWDSSLLYYPWGDSRWRPYLSLGFGLAEFNFTDDLQQRHRRNLLEMPLGVGLKYRLHDWLTLRADVTDNLAFGSSGLATMNNVSFTTGMEFRFGGCHKSYWPWEPTGAR